MPLVKRFSIVLSLLLAPGLAYAQAWVPQPGQGFFTLEYQYTNVGDHLFSDDFISNGQNLGKSADRGDIRGNSLAFSFDYGVFRKLAVSGSLPFIRSKYSGEFPENPDIDDGNYHSGLQDLSLAARYMLNVERFAVTPLFSAAIPTHDYETFGHTSLGRNIVELRPGIAVGRTLFPLIPSGYFHASYVYTFTEEIEGVGTDRSNLDLALGYFVTRAVGASVSGGLQIGHEGLDWVHDIHDEGDLHAHDRLAKASWFRLSGSVSYALVENLTVSLSAGTTLWGENTHDATSVSLLTSWGVGFY